MKSKYWHHTGGGTLLQTRSKHPSYDGYERGDFLLKTQSTTEAHFNMPHKIRGVWDLKRRKGILKITKYKKVDDEFFPKKICVYKGLNP